MTVVTASNKTFKVGDGVTTDIPYSFRIFADTDFVVLQTNVSTGEVTTLVLNTDYTVEGAGGYNGGKVIETVAAPVGIKTTIIRVRPALQEADLRNQGAYFAEVHEDVFDKLCMVDQQQQETLARSLVFPADVFPDDFNTELPSAIVGSPGATVMVNAAGDGFVRGPDASEITSGGASAAASALAAANSASSASNSLDATIIKAGEASDSADEAAASAASINPANLMHLDGVETATEKKIFAGGAEVPTPLIADDAANKSYVDSKKVGRNILINANCVINQLAKAGSVVLAAGEYGHDGFKAGAAGCTYTFAASGIDVVLTISAGTLIQVVEAANIAGGVYTLSNAGSAQARIGVNGAAASGSYAATPLQSASATANQTISVEFSTGTINRIQLEEGTQATPFERISVGQILMKCQRYYCEIPVGSGGYFPATYITLETSAATFPVAMYTTPTLTPSISYLGNGTAWGATSLTSRGFIYGNGATAAGYANAIGTVKASARL
tara:strand:+ start:460521 stop:462023 length:1503 start_codon:yes stop_codon:yes gene_type:complete